MKRCLVLGILSLLLSFPLFSQHGVKRYAIFAEGYECDLIINGDKIDKVDGEYPVDASGYMKVRLEKEGHIPIQYFTKKLFKDSIRPDFQKEMVSKTDNRKYLYFNKFNKNIKAGGAQQRIFNNFRRFYKDKPLTENKNEEEIISEDIEDRMWAIKYLAEKGYMDTTNSVFTTNYSNTCYVDFEQTTFTFNMVSNSGTAISSNYVFQLIYDVKIILRDFYREKITEATYRIKGNQYSSSMKKEMQELNTNLIQVAFSKFVEDPKISKHLFIDSTSISKRNYEDTLMLSIGDNEVGNMNEAVQSAVTFIGDKSHGSGFIIGKGGYIMSNYHVVSDTSVNKIAFSNGETADFELIRFDKNLDIALVKVDSSYIKDVSVFDIGFNVLPNIADEVYAIGTPKSVELSHSVSKGIISGIRKNKDKQTLIQTDASVNGGNSGGALINKAGEVQGIVRSKLYGWGIEGISFAIPIKDVLKGLNIRQN